MAYCVTVTHGEVLCHDSIIDFIIDYMDCHEERGFEVWEHDIDEADA
jgi:hypothetical protein